MSYASAFADDAALLPYRLFLIDQVRSLSLPGLRDGSDLVLPLADLYIERTLAAQGHEEAQSDEHNASVATLAELVQAPDARILLEGGPGSGKSTCLGLLALACAATAAGKWEHTANIALDWHDPLPLPLLIRARNLVETPHQAEPAPPIGTPLWFTHPSTPLALWPAVEDFLRQNSSQLFVTLLEYLQDGGCLVLIDGLDDRGDAAGDRRVAAAIEQFVARYPSNRYVVTHRGGADSQYALDGFARYALTPLDERQGDAMVARWLPMVASSFEVHAPDTLIAQVAILQNILHADDRLRGLASSPLALALSIRAHAEGLRLPAARGVILQRLADLRLDPRKYAAPAVANEDRGIDLHTIVSADQRQSLLEALAFAFQSLPDSNDRQPATLTEAEIEQLLGRRLIADGVDRGRALKYVIPRLLIWWQHQGFLSQPVPGSYAMPRQPLRDYLSARALAELPDYATRAYALRHDPRWREALLLALQECSRRSAPQAALAWLRLLLEGSETADRGSLHDLLLAAECLLELDEHADSEWLMREQVRTRLLAALESPASATADRIQAGMLLGAIGDPRFDALLPPMADIAAGSFILGSSEGFADEGPAQRVDLPFFAIGVYPVTNREYARFLADIPTYPQPHYWNDPRFNNPSQPVVGVTWDDANAYCAWLTARLAEAKLLPRDLVARLPREVEWEKAASWDPKRRAKRRYPWGKDWSNTRANTLDGRGTWLTVPVGCYPEGVSAYKVHDLVGNVWEWTANEYASYPSASPPFHDVGSYTLRGSSCASQPSNVRCTFRSRLPAHYWRYHLGFRIVLARPLNTPRENYR